MTRKLNFKRLGLSVLALLVGVGGVHLLHRYQVRRNAGALLGQADQAIARGDTPQAVEHLESYLAYEPGDTAALVKYVELLQSDPLPRNSRRTMRVLELMEQVLRREPTREAIRRKLVRQAIEVGQFSLARDHLKTLLQTATPDGELAYLDGRCLEAEGQYAPATAAYQKAINLVPGEPERLVIDCYTRRAAVQRRLGQGKEADQTLAALIQKVPHHPTAILLQVEQAAEKKDWDRARQLLEQGTQDHPQEERLHSALAELELARDRRKEARAAMHRGLDTLHHPSPEWLVQAAELLFDLDDAGQARQAIARLQKHPVLPAVREYLSARQLMSEQRWLEASRKLESARPLLLANRPRARKIDLALGDCFAQLGNRDAQLVVYRRALTADSADRRVRLALAETLAAQDRLEEALVEFRLVTEPSPAVRLAIARILLQRALRAAPADRAWAEPTDAVNKVVERMPDSAEAVVLQADLLVGQDKIDEAKKLLEDRRTRNPAELSVWLSLVNLANYQRNPEQARQLLDDATKQFGDTASLRLARARHLISAGGKAAATQLGTLETNVAAYSADDRLRLDRGLAEAYVALGETASAQRLWLSIADRQPNDLRVWLTLFELALPSGQEEPMTRYRERIKDLEGPDGVQWRWCEAARLIRLAEQDKKLDQLARAQELLTEIRKNRPTWRNALVLLGRIHELRDEPDKAIDHYQQAIKAGERRAELTQRTAQLLYQRRRYAEADALIRNMSEQELLSSELGRLAADLAARNQDPKRGLELARAVAEKSSDYRDSLNLGRMYWAAGRKTEAEAAFRKAITQDESAPGGWVALVMFLANVERRQEAEQTIEKAIKALKPTEITQILGPCYEAVGQAEKADRYYQADVQERPNDSASWRNLAQFHLRAGQLPKAIAPLRTLLNQFKGDPTLTVWARRNLALAVASVPGERSAAEGLLLLDQNVKEAGESSEDARTRAVILASVPDRQGEAIALLEKLNAQQALIPNDLFLLVRLYESRQEGSKARQHMLSLLATRGDNPQYVAHYAQGLIQQEELAQADVWVKKLEKLEPNGTLHAALKVRLLQARKEAPAAIAFVKHWAERQEERSDLAAVLLDGLGDHAAAEAYYRKYLATAKQPEAVLPLAQNLALQKRLAEALDLCEQAWQTCRPEAVANTSVAVLRAGGSPSPEQIRRVEHALEKARTKSDSPVILTSLADLRDFQERFDDAAALYREALKKEPRDLIALNNLAWIMALKERKGEEALTTINLAIQTAGPLPSLLDTRGVIHISNGQGKAALQDLQAAISQQSTAMRHFHLTRAHLLLGDRAAAEKNWLKARELRLTAEGLHPLERPAWAQVMAELKSSK